MRRETLRLRQGEEHTVPLPGKGAAGYHWAVRIEGDVDSVDVSVDTVSGVDRADLLAGASVDENATIAGRRHGAATVFLEQRRPWEREGAPVDRRTFDVEVT
jgi:predicted secreted protein